MKTLNNIHGIKGLDIITVNDIVDKDSLNSVIKTIKDNKNYMKFKKLLDSGEIYYTKRTKAPIWRLLRTLVAQDTGIKMEFYSSMAHEESLDFLTEYLAVPADRLKENKVKLFYEIVEHYANLIIKKSIKMQFIIDEIYLEE